jgi:prophage antirepressor-like protein
MADTLAAAPSRALSLSDLNTTVNHEPRVHDLRLAEALGFVQPRDIRKIIERNCAELNDYGVCATVAQTPSKGSVGGRPSAEYWLNEPQAILIAMFARTERAAEVRKQIVEVFLQWRRATTTPVTIIHAASTPQKEAKKRENRILFWRGRLDEAQQMLARIEPSKALDPITDAQTRLTLSQRISIASYAAGLVDGENGRRYPPRRDLVLERVFTALEGISK